jgi:hypothetical protein
VFYELDLFAPVVDALGPSVPTQIVRYPLADASDYATCEAIARAALHVNLPSVDRVHHRHSQARMRLS